MVRFNFMDFDVTSAMISNSTRQNLPEKLVQGWPAGDDPEEGPCCRLRT